MIIVGIENKDLKEIVLELEKIELKEVEFEQELQ